MKKSILCFLMLTPCLIFGQIIENLPSDESGKIVFSEVVSLDSMTEQGLYSNSKQFFLDHFKSSREVIQLDDKINFIVAGKAFMDINALMLGTKYPVKMWFTIKIQCKDGRYKYDIYDIYFENYAPNYVLPDGSAKSQTAEDIFYQENFYKKNGKPRSSNLHFLNETNKVIEDLIFKMKESMNNDNNNLSGESDW